MNLPEPQSVTYSALISQIENGSIKIPQFQRDFVWPRDASAKLLDSIIRGFPIGTFILWRTSERLRSIRNIGGIELPTPAAGEHISYVLDGQQRLTSLFVSLKALQVKLGAEVRDYGNVFIDLLGGEDEEETLVHLTDLEPEKQRCIMLAKLLHGDFQYLASFPPPQQEKISLYRKQFEGYQFSVIQVRDAPIEIATNIFTRLNTGGKALSVFEIMVAKTYDDARNFDLQERVQAIERRLAAVDFGALPPVTILHTAAACLKGDVSARGILRLSRKELIDRWEAIERALFAAVEYLRNFCAVPLARLLPFPVLVAAYAYFFFKTGEDRPNAQQRPLLKDFFWRVVLAGRYSASMESRLTNDLKKMDEFILAKPAHYEWPVDVSQRFIEQNGRFSANRSFIKGLLCLLAAHGPKSFDTGNPVRLRNNWLQRANSKNYHHFFPRAYMAKNSPNEEFRVNHIVNITLVDDHLNKRVIGAKAPSAYLEKIRTEGGDAQLATNLLTHYIDLAQDGVLANDFNLFFEHRVAAFSAALRQQIIPQAGDAAATILPEEDETELEVSDGDDDASPEAETD